MDEQSGDDTLKDDETSLSATLFMANLDQHATEEDLNSVFSRFYLGSM